MVNLAIVLKNNYKIMGCCCGHKKYPMTVVIKRIGEFNTEFFELISGESISRTRRFYKKDKQGYYFIPETVLPPKHNYHKIQSKKGKEAAGQDVIAATS